VTKIALGELESAEKWEVQLRKGSLELVIPSLWDGRLYGLEILRRLENDSDLIVAESLGPYRIRVGRVRLRASAQVLLA
jgi:hypothetical protein